jgi:transcriptional regulator with XRE-family HTH domain
MDNPAWPFNRTTKEFPVSNDPARREVPETVSRACTESAGTVQALASEVGVSYAALCSWSRGRRQPPPHRLRRLADVLDDRSERLREIAGELRACADGNSPAADRASGSSLTAEERRATDGIGRFGLRVEPSHRSVHSRAEPDTSPLQRVASSRGDLHAPRI